MTDINGLRYLELTFAADGSLINGSLSGGSAAADGGLPDLIAGGVTDVFLFSHGWNSSASSARSLYNDLFGQLAGQLGDRLASSVAVGVFWPSLLFPEDDPGAGSAATAASAVIDATAATAGTEATTAVQPSSGAELARALAPAFPAQQHNLTEIGQLLDQQPQDAEALQRFHMLAAGLVTTPSQGAEDVGEAAALTADTAAVFGHAAAMTKSPTSNAQGAGNPFGVLWSGGREVLRTLSYYEMKNRAGVVGQRGLGPLLGRLAAAAPSLRVHLMGHSFGARLVSYALAGLPETPSGSTSPVKSLVLVQGAFSHFAFAHPLPIDSSRSGALAGMADRVDGPLIATFSAHDRAVGWWYPAASMLKHEDSQGADDLAYRWGAMGHDGYQGAGTVTTKLAAPGTDYGFSAGGFYLLDSNDVICAMQSAFSGAHGDIRHPEVSWAWANAAGIS
jgi:hypothetical protein